jgi:hypothetical protein
MKWVHRTFICSLSLLASLSMAIEALAQVPPRASGTANAPIRFIPNLDELSDAGTPPIGGSGGGTRGNCPTAIATRNTQLTPLIPNQVGWSATSKPILWVYNPYSGTAPLSATVLLRDGKDSSRVPIAPITIPLPASPGIVKVPLTQPLESKRLYRWYFTVICNPQDSSENADVSGWVRWVAPSTSLQKQLTSASNRQKAALYAQNGYWYDVLELLAKDTTAQDWAEFLKSGSAGLEAIAQEKVLP